MVWQHSRISNKKKTWAFFKLTEVGEFLTDIWTMVVCKCHKATQLYCFMHKIPVCGDCVCLPEHRTCEVGTYSEWIVNGFHEFSSRCSSCSQTFNNTNGSVIRLSCLHVLHTHCLLQLLQRSPSATGYTCPSCLSKIWPPEQHLVKSNSMLCKIIEDVLVKNTILINRNDALLQLSSEPLLNSSDTSFVTGQDFQLLNGMPHMTVSTSLTSCAALYEEQPMPKMHVSNNHSDHSFSAENDNKTSISSVKIDIEVSDFSSTENFGAKDVGNPKLTKVLSRKISRGDKRTNDCPVEEETGRGSKYTPKGLQTEIHESLFPCSSPKKMILPIMAPAQHKETDSQGRKDLTDGRWRRYRRSGLLDPRKVLFTFATISSIGTIILIYFTLAFSKMDQDLFQTETQWIILS